MSLTRAQVLTALREYGQPITPTGLAAVMHSRSRAVSDVLQKLAFKDQVDRRPHPFPSYRAPYVYVAKGLQS